MVGQGPLKAPTTVGPVRALAPRPNTLGLAVAAGTDGRQPITQVVPRDRVLPA